MTALQKKRKANAAPLLRKERSSYDDDWATRGRAALALARESEAKGKRSQAQHHYNYLLDTEKAVESIWRAHLALGIGLT
jgi:hypothetical protein